jgi:hypothetical protein
MWHLNDGARVEGSGSVQAHCPKDITEDLPCDGRPGAMSCRMRTSDCGVLISANSEVTRHPCALAGVRRRFTAFTIDLYVDGSMTILGFFLESVVFPAPHR